MTLAAKLEDARFMALREGKEKGLATGLVTGHTEGERDAKTGVVKRLLEREFSMEEIADVCSMDLEEVKKLRKKTSSLSFWE